ncbi:MAG: cytochrome c [Gammaproteobacteria bacterium]|jgi:mono/diheme cytochrome c family protein|nr:cytochrome c [Gammaproteobacteria bacterium]MDP6617324.1 cytochrome c [Gammaproteobacteria bacterium]MDP6694102.1 cytochrome c [Gammaproteobacteria bacterium]MDP7041140.1 cytochrome c [Gammaproteobacteria bacterium]
MTTQKNRLEVLLLVVVGTILLLTLYVYLRADSELNRKYDIPLAPLDIVAGSGTVAEGERLTRIRGCFWCHGASLEGQKYFAEAGKGIIAVAPDLTRIVRRYTPAEVARTVRHGVKPDGTSLQPAMPSFAYYNMSDTDMAAIITYIKSLPEQNGLEGRFEMLPIGWLRWVLGQLPPNVADLIDHTAPRPDPALTGSAVERGRYLAESICTECHGDNGRIRVPGSPNLEITAAYSKTDFIRLIRTGVPMGERNIDYHMVDASKYRYTLLTEAEINALYAYFRSLVPGALAE